MDEIKSMREQFDIDFFEKVVGQSPWKNRKDSDGAITLKRDFVLAGLKYKMTLKRTADGTNWCEIQKFEDLNFAEVFGDDEVLKMWLKVYGQKS